MRQLKQLKELAAFLQHQKQLLKVCTRVAVHTYSTDIDCFPSRFSVVASSPRSYVIIAKEGEPADEAILWLHFGLCHFFLRQKRSI